jgi:hypothetical protein
MAIFCNLGGGRDVTLDTRRLLQELRENERMAGDLLQALPADAIAEHDSERIRRSES